MSQPKTCILGGTGFVGRNIAADLLAKGHQVIIPTRHRERNRDLLVYPSLSLVEADIYDSDSLDEQFQGVDTVINLVGILNENRHKNQNFETAHVELARRVLDGMAKQGVPRLLHMSASNASPDGPSLYLRSKGVAEDLVHEHAAHHGYAVTTFRPSVIFGPDDDFVNRFAALLEMIPLVFPLACPNAQLQPVYVDDVARCFTLAIDDKRTFGQRYNLCGPDVFTLYEIVDQIAGILGLRRKIFKLAPWQSKLQAAVMQWFPGKPFTPDNYESLQVPSTCDQPFPEVFGIEPKAMRDIVRNYLVRPTPTLDILRKRVPE